MELSAEKFTSYERRTTWRLFKKSEGSSRKPRITWGLAKQIEGSSRKGIGVNEMGILVQLKKEP